MALDTTIGGVTADSYVTLAEYQARATALGWTLAATDAANEINLRNAARSIDAVYSFVGVKQYQYQALSWSRLVNEIVNDWPVNPDTIPLKIKQAQMEMAYLIQGGADALATIDGIIKRKREKLDVIEEETEYFGGKGNPSYPAVTKMLRGYIIGGPDQSRMIRG